MSTPPQPGELERASRIRGCLLGGAIGDALGAPIEFMSYEGIQRRFGEAGVTAYVPIGGRIGVITDDTQMTLFTAEGLMRADNRFSDRGLADPIAVVHRAYLRWLSTQDSSYETVQAGREQDPSDFTMSGWLLTNRSLFDVQAPGNSCLSALRSGRLEKIPTAGYPDGSRPYAHDGRINDSKGCGGVMRVAPVGLIAREPFRMGGEVAALTHGHPTGYLAAGALARIVAEVQLGASLRAAVDTARHELSNWPGHEETSASLNAALALANSRDTSPQAVESLGGGWIAEEALAIAVFAALSAEDFRSGVMLAVNHGGDSDSTGAIAGNILGAFFGAGALPNDLLDGLELRDLVDQVASDFIGHFVGQQQDLDRYPPN